MFVSSKYQVWSKDQQEMPDSLRFAFAMFVGLPGLETGYGLDADPQRPEYRKVVLLEVVALLFLVGAQ